MSTSFTLPALWHPLIICLAGLRPALGEREVRGHLALRQGTSPPAPPFQQNPQQNKKVSEAQVLPEYKSFLV